MAAIYIAERLGSTWSPGMKAFMAFIVGAIAPWIILQMLDGLIAPYSAAFGYIPSSLFGGFLFFTGLMIAFTVYFASKPLDESFVKYTSEGRAIG